jgi:hypothetical protein
MKSLRHVLVVAVALAASSAAPSGARQKEPPVPNPAQRRQDAPGPNAPGPNAAGQDALREMFTELAAENVKLRKEVKDLRADNDALNRKLQESEQMLREWRANRGALVVPPQAPGQQPNGVPRSWRPFEFNGATYYVVPLQAEQENGGARPNTAMEVAPTRPAPREK